MIPKQTLRRSLSFAAGAAALFISTAAIAGECPADKVMADATKPGATEAKGVMDTVLTSIDLKNEKIMADNRSLRLRKLVIEPGGIVPWHSHGDRPAIIYIVSGNVAEYASNCAVPIMHKAGDTSRETHEVAHWWKNTGNMPAVLLSADIVHEAKANQAKNM
jgi:quercetin dioxygenase-like cupin family protein